MPSRRQILTTLVAIFLAPRAVAQGKKRESGPIMIAGGYRAEGRNPDGSAYSGIVEISQSGQDVAIAWRVGTDAYRGVGVVEGRVVTIDWGAAAPVIYVVMPDGALHGTWNDGTALERLTPR